MKQWVVALYWGIHYPLAWIFIEVFDFLDTCHTVLHRAHWFLLGYVYLIFDIIMVYMRVSLVDPSF
jgi:hypothetical protein